MDKIKHDKKTDIFKILIYFFTSPDEFLREIRENNYRKFIMIFTFLFFFMISFPIQRAEYISSNPEISDLSEVLLNSILTTFAVAIVFFLRNYFFYLFYLFSLNFLTLRKEKYINQSIFVTVFTVSIIKSLDTFIVCLKTVFFADKNILSSGESFRRFIDIPVKLNDFLNFNNIYLQSFFSYITIFHIAEFLLLTYFFSKIYRSSYFKSAIPIILVWVFIFIVTITQSGLN